jgi:transcriptional regulator with GAF, ATPase, and Fis domain
MSLQFLPQRIHGRKTLLVTAGLLSLLYALTVLVYVPFTPDIGFQIAFSPVVKRVSRAAPELPAVDDVILKLGNYGFPKPNEPQFWAQVQLFRQLNKIRQEPLTDANQSVLRLGPGGEKEILVRFRRPSDPAEPKEAWCRLERYPLADLVPSILLFVLKVGLFTVGALVFWKRPGDPPAAQFFLLCIVDLGAYMGGYHWNRIATEPVLILPFMVCAVLFPAVSLHFYLVFPRPKSFLVRHSSWTALAIYALPTGFLIVLVGGYFYLRSVGDGSSREQVANAWSTFGTGATVYLQMASLWYLASVVALIHSYWTAADLTERNQVKWILLGSLVALAPIGYSLFLVKWNQDDFGGGGATWPMFAASVCFTVAFTVSITRYRLMQLDQLLSSGAVYFVISFLAGLVYYAVVFVAMLLSGVIKAPTLAEAASFGATALVFLLALDLVRGRFKKALDRRFDREKHQLDRTLRRMREAIEQLVDPPTLARRLLQASADLLNVARGAVYLREGDPPLYRLAGTLGPSPPPLTELSSGCPLIEMLQRSRAITARPDLVVDPAQRQLRLLGGSIACAVVHEEQLLAFVILGPKNVGSYGPADFNLLAAFAQLTSLALESAKGHHTIETLNRDLQAKVEKISEQQHRILALQNQLMKRGARLEDQKAHNDHAPDASITAIDNQQAPPSLQATGIIGCSSSIRSVLDMIRKAAASPSAVLICGESGTGKELLARALHENSPRAGKAYVKVHCAALSPSLLESELFGHVKGAFTGAHRDKIGRFELANGGTLFLDEIGDISLETQTKLLRVLQEKTFERVGSSEPMEVDVRVIAATHQDLEELIAQGRFRKDLFFRLKVIPIVVPPLRQRPEDIPELVLHFLRLYSRRCGKTLTQVDDDALAALKNYPWPGNVRELENVIERAVVVTEGDTVTLAELPPEILPRREDSQLLEPAGPGDMEHSSTLVPAQGLRAEREKRGQREREQLVRALAAADGNKAEAARALGLARSTLVSRLKKHGLS